MQRVSMFIPCLVDLFVPDIGTAAVTLLNRLGVDSIYHKEQTCCGQPAINTGHRKQAKKVAKHFIKVFGDDEVVVSPSGSCIYTVKHLYPELFKDEPVWRDWAEALGPRMYELSQFIVDVMGVSEVGASFDGQVVYHESCHLLRGLKVSEQPKKLIQSVKGTELLPLPNAEACCGFGGEFALNHPAISEAMVEDKVKHYLGSGAELLILSEPGCLLNIGGYLERHHPEKKVTHIANFLTGGIADGG
jgi:L-lactate dehydrogenase complex protein LldE